MPHVVRFGSYEADLDSGQLRKRGTKIRLRYQLFQVLGFLLEHPGQVISREDLQRRLWGDDVSVDFENNLNTAVAQLREVLGDSAEHPSYIETLPKRGYRFVANVHDLPGRPPLEKPVRLLVLPFVNLTGDAAQEYIADAITDEVITALASLSPYRLAVIARTTAMHYKGSHKELSRIGRELAVDYAVEGAVRRSNHNVELNVQVIRARDETHVFARKYEAVWNDLFTLQTRIASEIALQLGLGVHQLATDPPAPPRPTLDLIAYREYMHGRSILGTSEEFAAARHHFETAVARDPEFAHAHDALADVYWYMGYLGFMPPRKAFSIGLAHAMRALEIDNTRGETHALVAQFHKAIDYNWPEVHREMMLALRLDPNSPLVLTRYAVSDLMPHGHLKEAIAALEHAVEFDPLSIWARHWLGIVLVLNRNFERAIEQGRTLLEIDPSSPQGNFLIGVSSRYLGRCDEAMAALLKGAEVTDQAPIILGWLGLTFATSGRPDKARDLLQHLEEQALNRYVPPTCFAWIHLGLQEIDACFRWLDRAVEECDQLIMPIKSYGFLDPIRTDPRFAALLQKMRLEP